MKKDSLEKKIAAYVTLAAAYMAAHPVEANAQVMYTDVNPDLSIYNSFFNLDLNNDGVTDFKLQQNNFFNEVSTSNGGCTITTNDEFLFQYGQNRAALFTNAGSCFHKIKPFAAGVNVGTQLFFGGNPTLLQHNHHQSCWSSSAGSGFSTGSGSGCVIGLDKFLALKLVSNNQVYYGWARLNVGYSSNLLVLKDYAINTIPDSSVVTAINPGCGGAVSLAPSGYQVYCSNDSLAVTVLNSAGQNVQWLKNGNWIAGETDSLFYISQPGNYAALVFDSVCSVIATTVQVAQEHFTLDASAADEHCGLSNGSVNVYANGNSSGFHYLWSNGATTYHVSGLSAGVYEVTVTSAICPDTAITSVEVLNTSGPQLFETHTDSVCNHNGDINLSVTNGAPPYTYHWNTNSASQDLHNLDAGIYSVTVHDASGCYLFETITLLNAGPQLSQIHTTTCDSTSSIDLTVNGGVAPFSYLWNIGQTTEDLNNLSPATYSVTVTDNNGCSSSLGVAVSSGPFPHPIIYQTGNVLNTSTAFTSYQWYLNGNIIPGATNYQFTPQQSGSYKVVAVDSTGCSGTSIAFYFAPVNVNDPERDFQFTVTVDNNKNLLFHLANNALMGAQIDIVNELGQLAASVTVTNQTPGADLSALPGGIYFYHIRSKQKTYSGKFIIE